MLKKTAKKIINLIGKINPKTKNGETKRLSPFQIAGISALASLAVMAAVFAAGNLNFGYKLICDEVSVGITEKKSEAEKIVADAREELSKIPSAREAEEIKISLTVAKKEDFKKTKDLKDAVVACYDGKTACFGIFADGKHIVNLKNETEAAEVLESYKNEFRTDGTTSLSFDKKIEIKPARAVNEEISDKNGATAAFKTAENKDAVYTAEKDMTIAEISEKLHISTEDIKNSNPSLKEEKIKKGDSINYKSKSPAIAVISSRDITNKETVAYETKEINDESSYVGTTTVITPGQTGEKEVKYRILSANGVEYSRKTLAEKVIKNPVAEEVKVGTLPRPVTGTTGSFMNPYHGVLTSRYGSYRSRGIPHTGIDLAGPSGDSVVAADGGTVSFAGWKGSYGNLVIIKHDNGYETYYAHLSGFKVSAGENVNKGQLIGLIGSTGNSTGPHLHFEVRLNGKNINPHQFISTQ